MSKARSSVEPNVNDIPLMVIPQLRMAEGYGYRKRTAISTALAPRGSPNK